MDAIMVLICMQQFQFRLVFRKECLISSFLAPTMDLDSTEKVCSHPSHPLHIEQTIAGNYVSHQSIHSIKFTQQVKV